MSMSFEEAEAQVQRLMEQAGGSIDAYETPKASELQPNPFGEGDALPDAKQDHGLVVDNPEVYHPSKEEEDLFAGASLDDDLAGECGFGMGPEGISEPPPIGDEYEYHDVTERCGELDRVRAAFCLAKSSGIPQEVELDSGTYLTDRHTDGGWVLADPEKNIFYREEVGNLSGHRGTELFIWVKRFSDPRAPDVSYGYIHLNYVFLKKGD